MGVVEGEKTGNSIPCLLIVRNNSPSVGGAMRDSAGPIVLCNVFKFGEYFPAWCVQTWRRGRVDEQLVRCRFSGCLFCVGMYGVLMCHVFCARS